MASFYQDRIALVVGASEGIGQAVAEGLDARGAHVVAAARRPEPLHSLCASLRNAVALPLDVTDRGAVTDALNRMVADVGVPSVVVNCAGLAHPAWLTEAADADLDEMLTTNLMGTMHVCKTLVPHMISRREGTIVNTSSLGGLLGLYGYTGYCASKFAVVGFSEALRREVAPYGVSVTVLCPPNTRTPGLERENRFKPAEVLAQEESVSVVEASFVARRLLDALPRRPRVFIPTFDGKMAWLLSRWAPWVIDVILRRKPSTPAEPPPARSSDRASE